MSEVANYAQIGLLIAALVYFWVVMFDRFTRSCSLLAGVILVGVAGGILLPENTSPAFDLLATIGISGLLVARSWLIWKEWRNGHQRI